MIVRLMPLDEQRTSINFYRCLQSYSCQRCQPTDFSFFCGASSSTLPPFGFCLPHGLHRSLPVIVAVAVVDDVVPNDLDPSKKPHWCRSRYQWLRDEIKREFLGLDWHSSCRWRCSKSSRNCRINPLRILLLLLIPGKMDDDWGFIFWERAVERHVKKRKMAEAGLNGKDKTPNF